MTFSEDIYEVTNSESSYKELVRVLLFRHWIIFPWTDGRSSHFDIVLSYHKDTHIEENFNLHLLQGGLRSTDLFVSVMRKGAFGFRVAKGNWSSPQYVAEKLNIEAPPTAEALADLINGVRDEIQKQTKQS